MATALPRVVDAHSLPHLKLSKAARACLAADILDGAVRLENHTIALVAKAVGVSVGYVIVAQRLVPEQRGKVRDGKRPLILPRTPTPSPIVPTPPATPPAVPVTVTALAPCVRGRRLLANYSAVPPGRGRRHPF